MGKFNEYYYKTLAETSIGGLGGMIVFRTRDEAQRYCRKLRHQGIICSPLNMGNGYWQIAYDPHYVKNLLKCGVEPTQEGIKDIAAAGIIGLAALGGSIDTEAKTMPDKTVKKETIDQNAIHLVKELTKNQPALIKAMIMKESSFDPFAFGDRALKDHAYGILQIRKPVLIDVNRRFKTDYVEADCIPKDHSPEAIKTAVFNSIDIFNKYNQIYSSGMPDEVKARNWNGGPKGHIKPQTVGYWSKVKEYMTKLA